MLVCREVASNQIFVRTDSATKQDPGEPLPVTPLSLAIEGLFELTQGPQMASNISSYVVSLPIEKQ